jgi:hypothetical protein
MGLWGCVCDGVVGNSKMVNLSEVCVGRYVHHGRGVVLGPPGTLGLVA